MPRRTPKKRTVATLNRLAGAPSGMKGSSGPPSWSGSGTQAGPLFTDWSRSRRAPSLPELVEQFKGITYACATLNANGVARVPLRLYATTSRGQGRPKSWSCPTRPVGAKSLRYLSGHKSYSKALTGQESVDEVIDHPLLEMMTEVNPDFDHNFLIRWSVLCLDVVGSLYWWPEMLGGKSDIPGLLWPLMAQYVLPIRSAMGSAVAEFNYFGQTYQPEDLIRVRHPGVRDPYMGGYGPTQAAFAYVGLSDQYASVQENILNGPRPTVIVSNKDPKENMGPAERSRFEREINYRLSGAGSGRAWVVDGSVDVHPFSFPPTDLAALDVDERAVQRVANGFGTPISLLKTQDVNLANAEAGHRQHAELGIEPRCVMLASGMTKWTRARGRALGNGWERLFWAFDDPVPEDREREARVFDLYVRNGVSTINDVRNELSEPPQPWGDEPWMSNTLTQPSIATGQSGRPASGRPAAHDPEPIEELDEDEGPSAGGKRLGGPGGTLADAAEDARLLAKLDALLDAVGTRVESPTPTHRTETP